MKQNSQNENNNMVLWKQVAHTNPKYTKPFPSFGKTLTTIDPMYQIMTMTGTFGPVGRGWNYTVNYTYTDKCVFAEVSVATQKREDSFWDYYGPVSSVQPLFKKNGTLDTEAPKKAMTDALTKAFSHLGVSADVFLGLFDSNKYVDSMKEKFKEQESNTANLNLVNFNSKGK